MAEYINRELLKKRFLKRLDWLKKDIHDEYSGALYDCCEVDAGLIDEILAADVVPVVRCKDCIHCGFCGDATNLQVMGFYGFCSRGKRKDGGDNDAAD